MNDEQLKKLLDIIKIFSDDIKMEFGLDKCAKGAIKELDQEGTYKYLGINEGDGIQHSKMKEKIRKEYYKKNKNGP